MPLRPLTLAALLLALALPASAGTKLDLSPYLSPPRMPASGSLGGVPFP
jgi:hypothetical protein